MEWSGVEWSGVEWSGVEWSGVEWSGVEWSGVEWSGVERRGAENACRDVATSAPGGLSTSPPRHKLPLSLALLLPPSPMLSLPPSTSPPTSKPTSCTLGARPVAFSSASACSVRTSPPTWGSSQQGVGVPGCERMARQQPPFPGGPTQAAPTHLDRDRVHPPRSVVQTRPGVPSVLDLHDLDAGVDRHAVLGELFQEQFRRVGVFSAEELRGAFQARDVAAEARHGLRQLQPDGPAPDDHHARWQLRLGVQVRPSREGERERGREREGEGEIQD